MSSSELGARNKSFKLTSGNSFPITGVTSKESKLFKVPESFKGSFSITFDGSLLSMTGTTEAAASATEGAMLAMSTRYLHLFNVPHRDDSILYLNKSLPRPSCRTFGFCLANGTRTPLTKAMLMSHVCLPITNSVIKVAINQLEII